MSKPKVSRPNWFLRIIVTLLVFAGIGWGVRVYLRPTAQVNPVMRGKAVKAVPGTVEVKAEFAMELKSEVGGRVKTSALEIGKHVKQGDVLVQIDTGDVDIEIEQNKNEIVAARRRNELGSTFKADVDNFRDTLDNLERQTKAGSYPAADLEKQRRLYQQLVQKMELDVVSLKLSLDTFENSLKAKELEKAKMTIVAPADGIVTSVVARVGDLIGSNSTIGTINAVGLTVEGKLSEEKFASVRLGQKATVRFLTFGGDHYDATVTKILPAADPTTQRYTVYLDVKLPEGRVLVPGLTGELFIVIAERPNALLVPSRALFGDHLYVVENDRVVLRQVEKGYESLNQTEILSGVKEGDEVIVEELDRFREGDQVRVQVVSN